MCMMGDMLHIRPNLWYDGNAEEAVAFYMSVFPGGRVQRVVRSAADNPSTKAGDVLLVEFNLAGIDMVAINGGPKFTFTEAISLEILCDDQAEADHYWEALVADGGEHSQCGWLKDRYGLSWQVVPREATELLVGPDPAGAARAMEAMLEMQRLDVAALRAAYNGE